MPLCLQLPPRNSAVDFSQHGYLMEEFVGKGQFGKAYKVKFAADNSIWLAKSVDLTTLDEKDKLLSLQEAAVMQTLRHPGIVEWRETFVHLDMFLVIIMEFCPQGDLASKMEELKRYHHHFSENEIIRLVTQLSEGLHYLHSKNILHRDIKPSNIFLTETGNVKIGDFGISRLLTANISMASTAIGTPQYMAPEMCENKPYTYKSDIWALGCVTYEAAALKGAFESDSFLGLISSISSTPPQPLPSYYSRDLQQLVNSLLSKLPENRPSAVAILKLPYIQHQRLSAAVRYASTSYLAERSDNQQGTNHYLRATSQNDLYQNNRDDDWAAQRLPSHDSSATVAAAVRGGCLGARRRSLALDSPSCFGIKESGGFRGHQFHIIMGRIRNALSRRSGTIENDAETYFKEMELCIGVSAPDILTLSFMKLIAAFSAARVSEKELEFAYERFCLTANNTTPTLHQFIRALDLQQWESIYFQAACRIQSMLCCTDLHSGETSYDSLQTGFQQFDIEGEGTIPRASFRTTLHIFYPQLNASELDEIFNFSPKTLQGDIIYIDFIQDIKKIKLPSLISASNYVQNESNYISAERTPLSITDENEYGRCYTQCQHFPLNFTANSGLPYPGLSCNYESNSDNENDSFQFCQLKHPGYFNINYDKQNQLNETAISQDDSSLITEKNYCNGLTSHENIIKLNSDCMQPNINGSYVHSNIHCTQCLTKSINYYQLKLFHLRKDRRLSQLRSFRHSTMNCPIHDSVPMTLSLRRYSEGDLENYHSVACTFRNNNNYDYYYKSKDSSYNLIMPSKLKQKNNYSDTKKLLIVEDDQIKLSTSAKTSISPFIPFLYHHHHHHRHHHPYIYPTCPIYTSPPLKYHHSVQCLNQYDMTNRLYEDHKIENQRISLLSSKIFCRHRHDSTYVCTTPHIICPSYSTSPKVEKYKQLTDDKDNYIKKKLCSCLSTTGETANSTRTSSSKSSYSNTSFVFPYHDIYPPYTSHINDTDVSCSPYGKQDSLVYTQQLYTPHEYFDDDTPPNAPSTIHHHYYHHHLVPNRFHESFIYPLSRQSLRLSETCSKSKNICLSPNIMASCLTPSSSFDLLPLHVDCIREAHTVSSLSMHNTTYQQSIENKEKDIYLHLKESSIESDHSSMNPSSHYLNYINRLPTTSFSENYHYHNNYYPITSTIDSRKSYCSSQLSLSTPYANRVFDSSSYERDRRCNSPYSTLQPATLTKRLHMKAVRARVETALAVQVLLHHIQAERTASCRIVAITGDNQQLNVKLIKKTFLRLMEHRARTDDSMCFALKHVSYSFESQQHLLKYMSAKEVPFFIHLMEEGRIILQSMADTVQQHRLKVDHITQDYCGLITENKSSWPSYSFNNTDTQHCPIHLEHAQSPDIIHDNVSWSSRFIYITEKLTRDVTRMLDWMTNLVCILRNSSHNDFQIITELKELVATQEAFLAARFHLEELKGDWEAARFFMGLVVARKSLTADVASFEKMDSESAQLLSELEAKLLHSTDKANVISWHKSAGTTLLRFHGASVRYLNELHFDLHLDFHNSNTTALPSATDVCCETFNIDLHPFPTVQQPHTCIHKSSFKTHRRLSLPNISIR